MQQTVAWLKRYPLEICLALVLVTSFWTYFYNYQNPQAFFWDENYHVASAQKYLNGVYFMEPHPPLGKLLIALGEKIVNANAIDNQFINTDYAQNPPDGFSFTGYRLFPALLGWLTAGLFFWIFFLVTKKPVWAMLLSSLYIFDTAQIVHGRGAMLETTMLFFSLLSIIGVLLLRTKPLKNSVFVWAAVLFGFGFGCALATKAFALILVLLLPAIFVYLWPNPLKTLLFLTLSLVFFLIPYVTIWQIHFALGSNINPALPDNGYYQASEQYKTILSEHRNTSLLSFPTMIRDSIHFVGHYQQGVPRLDLCKADENGSPWFLWPVGGRTINYRWATDGGGYYRYLTLQSNPATWLFALFAVVLCGGLAAAQILRGGTPLKEPTALLTFFMLYVCFFIAVSQITRVMYLYHYFLPLSFACILVGLFFLEIDRIGSFVLTEARKTYALVIMAAIVFLAFQSYRPLAYYEPLADAQVKERNLLKVWELHCARCTLESPIVVRPAPTN